MFRTTASTARSARRGRKVLVAGALALAAGVGLAAPVTAAPSPAIGGVKTGCPAKTIYAQYDGQVIHGTCGDDTIFVYDYEVTVYGYEGNDSVRAGWGGGTVTAYLGKGDDRISTNGDKRVIAFGQEGNDNLKGGDFDDILNGGAGNDRLAGGNGKNHLYGEGGDDVIDSDSYGVLASDWSDGGAGFDTAIADIGVDHLNNFELLVEGTLG